jgi:hypothetical protein
MESLRRSKTEFGNAVVTSVEPRSGRSLDLPRPTEDLSDDAPTPDIVDSAVELVRENDMGAGMTGPSVLLADDNATNLEVLTRMLLLEKVKDVQLAMVSQPTVLSLSLAHTHSLYLSLSLVLSMVY